MSKRDHFYSSESAIFHQVAPTNGCFNFIEKKKIIQKTTNRDHFSVLKIVIFHQVAPKSPPSKIQNLFKKRLTATIFKQGPI